MEIKFYNSKQIMIADMMWEAKDMGRVGYLLNMYGTDAYVVYNMLLAHYFDEVMDTDLAKNLINDIRGKNA